MYCVDANTGNLVWSHWAGSYEIRSSPAIANGLIYFIDDNLDGINGKVYCLNATNGATVWSYVTGTMGGFSSPAVANGIVFVGAGDWFYAIDTARHSRALCADESIHFGNSKIRQTHA